MMMFKHALLPLDGSPLAEHALPYAKAICREGARITLLRVVDLPVVLSDVGAVTTPGLPLYIRDDPYVREQAQVYLRKVRSEFETSSSVIATEVVDSSDPAGAIVAFSDKNAVDLIVMVTHGRSGLSRLLMGSITQKVLQAASCPVLVVPRRLIETETQDLRLLETVPDISAVAT